MKPDGSSDVLVSKARRSDGPLAHNFSPDGKLFTFVEEKPWTNQLITQVYVYDIATKQRHLVSSGRFKDDSPAFSSDGKFLAYVSNRSIPFAADNVFSQLNSDAVGTVVLHPLSKSTPSPFRPKDDEESSAKPAEPAAGKVDLDGIESRSITVPGLTGHLTQVEVVGDRIVYVNGAQIGYYDISARGSGTLTSGSSFAVSADGKSLLLSGPRVIPVAGKDLPPAAGTVSMQGFKLDVDPVREWEQIYWDAWRLCRDYFYVRNMHGNDWDAIGRKYAALLPSVRARNELTEIIRWMQAELSIGHSFRADVNIFNAPVTSVPAFLGARTVADSGFHKIVDIFDGDGVTPPSPLLEAGNDVAVGSYILAVNGRPTPAEIDWRELLRDRAGQVVSITVNSTPSLTGAHTIYVKPHATLTERKLMDRDAVKKKRQYVAAKSGGKVGYIFLSAMGDSDMEDFAVQYTSQLDKEALIVDIRGNNGGYISAILVSILKKETYLRRSQRNSIEPSTRYFDAFEGHTCLLINENSYSDGEGGPANWHYAKLGPLIGTHTYGALVGSAPMWPLVDGGGIQVPRYGNYREDVGWVVEGPGMAPDIEVEQDPNLWAKGIDAQLDRAIQEMLDRVAKKPIHRPIQPADPVKVGKG